MFGMAGNLPVAADKLPLRRTPAGVPGRHRLTSAAILLLFAILGTGQAQHNTLLAQGANTGLNLDRIPSEGFQNEVVAREAGVPGVYLPPFSNQAATKLRPHTVQLRVS